MNSRFGLVIQGARSNEARMRAIGFPTYRYKLVCFVIAGTMAGLSGVLLANNADFVSPSMMYWTRSGDLIIMVVLGGMASPFGAVFGAVALLVLEEALSGITEYWQIILGPLLLLVVLFARGGIDGLLVQIGALVAGAAKPQAGARRKGERMSEPNSEPLLQISHLAKRFGGIVATDDVRLSIAPGELHAVIGPNGAGKTTLIAQLSGQLPPDSGRIRFAGTDITRLPVYKRSALGLARSFQITSLFLDHSVLDNVALAVQAHAGHSFRFWRDARREAELARAGHGRARARRASPRTPDRRAADLSHGEHRLLELAMALASQARACCCSTSRWRGWGRTNPRAWSRCCRR